MITSVTNVKIKEALKDIGKGFFLAEGKNLVDEAFKYGLIKDIFTIDEKTEGILVSENVMRKLCDTKSIVKVCAICKRRISNEIKNKVVILDNIQDPGNVGTIIRTMVSMGFGFLFLGEGCANVYSSKVIRATQGAIFKINIMSGDISSFLEELRKMEYYIYGTSLKGTNLSLVDKKDKMAVIFGNEGHGVRRDYLNKTDKNIFVEINGMESLNVAIAAGIILYKLREA